VLQALHTAFAATARNGCRAVTGRPTIHALLLLQAVSLCVSQYTHAQAAGVVVAAAFSTATGRSGLWLLLRSLTQQHTKHLLLVLLLVLLLTAA
jgi:hypothetical protein